MERPHRDLLRRSLLLVLPLCLVTALVASAAQRSAAEWFDPILDVRQAILGSFVDSPDEAAMQRAMLDAMVRALNDPYSVYVPPTDEREFRKQVMGSYVGIGAEIDVQDGWLVIVTPMEDSPALEAGLMAGDVIMEIDGRSTRNQTAEECVQLLAGEEGKPVALKVRHEDGTTVDVTVPRRQIVTRTIRGDRRSGDGWDFLLDPSRGIGYVRVTQFTDTTAKDLRTAITALKDRGLKGLILDLRFNGGGSLAAAIEMADVFLGSGTIVSVKTRRGEERTWSASDDPTDVDTPLMLLVNGGSASASEVVAGALQDNGRAVLLGTRTFGKGSVQEVRPLPDDRGTLKLTTARYYLPSGRNITRLPEARVWGVDPDPGMHVSMDDEEYRTLFRNRRRFDAIGASAEAHWDDPEWVLREAGDRQLSSAIEAMRSRLDHGEWPRVGGEGGTTAAEDEALVNERELRRRLMEELAAVDKRITDLQARRSGLAPAAKAAGSAAGSGSPAPAGAGAPAPGASDGEK